MIRPRRRSAADTQPVRHGCSAVSNSGFERFRLAYRELLTMALRHRAIFVACFVALVFGTLRSRALSRHATSFLSVDGGRILMHVRLHGWHPGRGKRTPVRRDRKDCTPRSSRHEELATLVDNIGFPVSGINTTYNNTGTIGSSDGEIQIELERGSQTDGGICARAARGACRPASRERHSRFCRRTLSVRF